MADSFQASRAHGVGGLISTPVAANVNTVNMRSRRSRNFGPERLCPQTLGRPSRSPKNAATKDIRKTHKPPIFVGESMDRECREQGRPRFSQGEAATQGALRGTRVVSVFGYCSPSAWNAYLCEP